MIEMSQAAEMLKNNNNILIICHKSPDGDTLGSGFGLYFALTKMKKNARVICSDTFPARYDFIYKGYKEKQFEPEFIVAVDLADVPLFGENTAQYSDKIDLCIDHHPSNTLYAKNTYLSITAATAEIIYELIKQLNVTFDEQIATALYTGICTDTGCFKYSNTTASTHRIAADMIDAGASYKMINRIMFDTKSPARIVVERAVYNSIEYFFDGKCALCVISQSLMQESGADEYEIEGISALPRQIEGVEVGITMRENFDGSYRVSIRTSDNVDASELAKMLGGGGHARAAGCRIGAPLDKAKKLLIDKVCTVLEC